MPVSVRMHTSDRNTINILGATVLRFSGKTESGETIETRQLTYVTTALITYSLVERHVSS